MEVGLQESSASSAVSPRISFSHDLSQVVVAEPPAAAEDDRHRPRLDLSLPLDDALAASSDFDFSLGADVFPHDSSLADDLFSDGKLLPLPIKTVSSSSSPPPPSTAPTSSDPPASPGASRRKRGSLREVMAEEGGAGAAGSHSPPKAAFWRFRRSSSLGYGGGDGGSLCSFPLLRSRSSGSSSPMQIRSSVKQCRNATPMELFKRGCISNESKTTATRVYYYSVAAANARRRVHGNAVRISPVLHVPTPTGMGLLSFLLCKRGDKNMGKSPAVVCSP